MASGTKIFLAVVAVLLAILVVYYGFLMPDPDSSVVMGARESDEPAEHSEPAAPGLERANAERERPTNRRSRPESDIAEELNRTPSVTMPLPSSNAEPAETPSDNDASLTGTNDGVVPEVRPATDASTRTGRAGRDGAETSSRSAIPPSMIPSDPDDTGGKDGPIPSPPAAQPEDSANERADEGADETASNEPGKPSRPASLRRGSAPSDSSPREQPPASEPSAPTYTDYVVKDGETMSSIAADWFGDPGKWDLIAKTNPYVDPNRLSIGQELRLPPKDAERDEITDRAGSRPTTYTVRSGDNLSKIARAYYGDSGLWRIIYEANRPTIGLSPNDLKVGMRLTVPPAPRPAEDD